MNKVLEFSTPTCGKCMIMAKKMTEAGISFEKMNCLVLDDEILEKYNISSVPVIIVEDEAGNVIKRFDGIFDVKELKEFT